jgi:glycosyltransferase involved in cell wall biosynthesis
MTRRSVLFVDHAGVLGGAELYLLDVARYYKDSATVVLFEDGPFRKRLEDARIPVHVVPAANEFLSAQKTSGMGDAVRALPGFLSLVRRIVSYARVHDIVFANSQKALVAAAPAAWWARRPFVWNLHDILTADHFSAVNRQLAVRCANMFATHVIANSEATRQAFVRSGGRRENTSVVYNGLDPEGFTSPPNDVLQELRQALDLPFNAPLIGIFSRLAPWKGQHVLLEALPTIEDAHVLLVGDALFDGDTDYANTLQAKARQLDISERVHFLGFRDDIPALMHLVDVVAHTSVAPEPFGRVIVEGMLAGTPVIATRAGGAREIIDSGVNGFLVEPGNPDALAETVSHLLASPQHAGAMAAAARRDAESRFSQTAMWEEIDAVLHPFLESG